MSLLAAIGMVPRVWLFSRMGGGCPVGRAGAAGAVVPIPGATTWQLPASLAVPASLLLIAWFGER